MVLVTDERERPALLCALPTPPPYSGPETVADLLLHSELARRYRIVHVRTTVSAANRQKGRMRLAAVVALACQWLELLRALAWHQPRVLYLFLSQNRTGFARDALLLLTAKAFRVRVIGQVHGANFGNFYRHASPVIRAVVRCVIRRVDVIILLADRFREQFRGLVPESRLRVLYNAVDGELFAGPRAAIAGGAEGVTVLFIGHLSTAKGFRDVLAAAPRLLERVPGGALLFLGEWLAAEHNIVYGEDGRSLAHDALAIREMWSELRHRYGDRLRHVEPVDRRGVAKLIAEADIFVLPSYSEGMPMTVLEAMAGGLPLVVTPVGALPEVLTEGVNALFVPPGDPTALAQALVALAEDPQLRARMGEANRQLARARFSPETMLNGLELLFQECLALVRR